MRSERAFIVRLLALLAIGALAFAACGGDDDDDDSAGGGGNTENTAAGEQGGEMVDLGTFVGDPPEHIDPALNTTLDAYQVINELYDGLTDIDTQTDPENPTAKPLVADKYEHNDDATEWTFHIADDAVFSNGEKITPTSFTRAWERASNPDFAGDYSYLFNFIEGGAEKLDGTAPTLSGVTADDASGNLTVKLSEPYANFPYIAGFQLFSPMPSDVDSLDDQNSWENGLMIGNGPYKLEKPRNDEEIVLVRNDSWNGDIYGNTTALLDKITFKVTADPDTSYNAMAAGEGDTANVPPGRYSEANADFATTSDVDILGSYYFAFKWDNPEVGGPENAKFRQAVSQAIDRESINEAVYEGIRTNATGVTPPGIPGFKEGICQYCSYDKDAAQASFDEWKADGHSQSEPLKIQFNTGAGHEDVVQIMIQNLNDIGIDAVADGIDTETYFTQLGDGACVFCRDGWYADYPTYDNFSYDLFASDSGNNHGFYSNPEYDQLVAEAKANTDADAAAKQYQDAEDILLNQDTVVVPINWYKGDYAWNPAKLKNFPQSNLGLIQWDQISLAS